MPSKLEISREVAAKCLKGVIQNDKYALHIARGIVNLVKDWPNEKNTAIA